MNFDNPAFRLLTLLEEGKKIDQNIACLQAWGILFSVKTNSPDLFVRMGKVMELPSLTISALRDAYPDESDTAGHWSAQVQNAFASQILNQAWSTFISKIDGHSINYLKMHSRLLQVTSKTKMLEVDVLMTTRSELELILKSLLDSSEMDHDVKVYLLRNLRKLIAAIEEYKLTGSVGIFDAIEILMGHTSFDPKYKKAMFESEVGNKIVGVVGMLADIMTIALGLPQIGGTIKALLGN